MTDLSPAMTLQVRYRDKVMEPYRVTAAPAEFENDDYQTIKHDHYEAIKECSLTELSALRQSGATLDLSWMPSGGR